MANCPLCYRYPQKMTSEKALPVTITSGLSVSPGHTQIISNRHIASIFEAAEGERTASRDAMQEAA